jgi:hypothetical protein
LSYFPLDRDILTSSVWAQGSPAAIKVWLYLLLEANPRTGMVEDSDPAIALRCGLSLEDTDQILEWLAGPDPRSRTPTDEGRRIRRIPGEGILIINYTRKRDKDYSTPRVQRWRERRTPIPGGPPPPRPVVGGACPCCGKTFQTPLNLFVVLDHDHRTGTVREYICQSCNKLVGQYENGKTVRGNAADYVVAYLERNAETVSETAGTTNKNTNKNKRKQRIAPSAPILHPPTTTNDSPNWNREAAEDFKAAYRAGPPDQFFGQLKPVVKRYGWEATRPALRAYMDETPEYQFLNIPKVLGVRIEQGQNGHHPPARAGPSRASGSETMAALERFKARRQADAGSGEGDSVRGDADQARGRLPTGTE